MNKIVQNVAVKAVLVRDGKVLLLRKAVYEGNAGNQEKWNLPGGRIEVGEAWKDALAREIEEETGITDFRVVCPVYLGEWTPTISGTPTQIICTFLLCTTQQEKVAVNHEHDDYVWIEPDEVDQYMVLPPEDEVVRLSLKYAELSVDE